MDDFEKELKEALERRPAPPSLKRRVMEQRKLRLDQRRRNHFVMWQRLAASLVLVGILGGVIDWGYRRAEEDRRKGEEARRQVLIALRITNHALNQVHTRLAAHDRGAGE